MTKASDIYEICLDRKSLCCIRQSGEDTCDKCKTYQMYKIGLEAGKPKWHDLRKNPKDLPERKVYVLAYNHNNNRYEICCAEADFEYNDESYWRDISYNIFEPTAWCELPKVEVEK